MNDELLNVVLYGVTCVFQWNRHSQSEINGV